MLVVRILHAVVESLVVVGIGACFEQQPRELETVLMRRLVQRPFGSMHVGLSQAEHSRQRGTETRKLAAPVPEKACVRIGAMLNQQPRYL